MPALTVLPAGKTYLVDKGANLRRALYQAGFPLDSPCGGQGTCGKCRIKADGAEVLACQTAVAGDMTVTLLPSGTPQILQAAGNAGKNGSKLAFDIGTTTLVCYLLDDGGTILASESMLNPQTAFGADVVSRIRSALGGEQAALTAVIRQGMESLARRVCAASQTDPAALQTVSVVGNPCMQQLFLGLSPENLAQIPFAPVLRRAETVDCGPYLPICPNAALLIVPDIAGFLGADTLGCVLAANLHEADKITLLLDIGTNGEMVLGNRERLMACATAAGPALEGASIRFGMRGEDGAIDRVWMENGTPRYSVIGGGEAKGICGSGLLDAVAVFLDAGLINRRGRILTDTEAEGQRVLRLTDTVYLTQEDIRQVQLAKGAIRSGIELLAEQMGIRVADIRQVLLAGAFGNYLDPMRACRIGLVPEELIGKITPAGNAAGRGAIRLAVEPAALPLSQALTERIEPLELASLPAFPRRFAKSMEFREGTR